MKNGIGTNVASTEFFDYWSKLAAEDPDRFERERKEAIAAVISKAPKERRERLERLQWCIDQERARAKTPLAACIALDRMMLRAIFVEGGLTDTYLGLLAEYLKFLKQYRSIVNLLSEGKPDASMLS